MSQLRETITQWAVMRGQLARVLQSNLIKEYNDSSIKLFSLKECSFHSIYGDETLSKI